MAQKVNPIILRLGKTKNWESKYFEKKSTETSIFTYTDLEIKNFIKQFLKSKGLMIHHCKLFYSSDGYIHVYISYYLTVKSLQFIKKATYKQKILIRTNKINIRRPFSRFLKKKTKKKKKFLKINFINKITKKNQNNNFSKKHTAIRQFITNKSIKKIITNYFRYQQINYKKKVKRNIQKKNLKLIKNNVKYEKEFFKIRRFKPLKLYKKYLIVQNKKMFKNIKTKLFIEKIFKSLYFFLNQKTKLILTFQQLNKNTKYILNNSKKSLIKQLIVNLRRYQENYFFKEGVNILVRSILYKNYINLLAQYIANELPKLKRHNFFLIFLQKALNTLINKNNLLFTGIRIRVKGRFNGAPRAKYRTIHVGKNIPIQKFNFNVEYAESTAYTSKGTFGIKIWLFKNKQQDNV